MKRTMHWLVSALALSLLAQGARGGSADVPPAEKYFTNVELVSQDGETLRLYEDLLRGRVVVINAIFTTCTGICPVMCQKLVKVQEMVGDRLGKDVHILSITLDPETDTPAKLKEYAAQWGARPGWYFLTGEQENVKQALFKLGQYVEQKETHKAVIIVGNEPTGLWKKAFGLATAPEIVEIVRSVLDDKSPG